MSFLKLPNLKVNPLGYSRVIVRFADELPLMPLRHG